MRRTPPCLAARCNSVAPPEDLAVSAPGCATIVSKTSTPAAALSKAGDQPFSGSSRGFAPHANNSFTAPAWSFDTATSSSDLPSEFNRPGRTPSSRRTVNVRRSVGTRSKLKGGNNLACKRSACGDPSSTLRILSSARRGRLEVGFMAFSVWCSNGHRIVQNSDI